LRTLPRGCLEDKSIFARSKVCFKKRGSPCAEHKDIRTGCAADLDSLSQAKRAADKEGVAVGSS